MRYTCHAHESAMTTALDTTPARAQRKITRRLIPFLFLLYITAYLDRVNVSFAGLEMTREPKFSNEVFGFGAGIFFFGYCLKKKMPAPNPNTSLENLSSRVISSPAK